MIGKVSGIVEEIEKDYLLLKTNSGISFQIYLAARTLQRVQINQEIDLYTHTHVRENELSLFGFINKEELRIFHLLIEVSGVGPKTANVILGFNPVEKLIAAVKNQDYKYFTSIPGLGKKTAQKILLELSSKFATEFKLPATELTEEEKIVLDALMALGFKKPEALKALEKTESKNSVEERITQTLQLLQK